MATETPKRESGYYWVKLGGEYFTNRWEVAEYRNWVAHPWYLTNHAKGIDEEALAEVGVRIHRPSEQTSEPAFDPLEAQQFQTDFFLTDDGIPDGGHIHGTGFAIALQKGQIETDQNGQLQPNGAITQTLIAVVISILEFYQRTKFANKYNLEAITYLKLAKDALRRRLKERQNKGILNTHEP